jgi:hypothetical protein
MSQNMGEYTQFSVVARYSCWTQLDPVVAAPNNLCNLVHCNDSDFHAYYAQLDSL